MKCVVVIARLLDRNACTNLIGVSNARYPLTGLPDNQGHYRLLADRRRRVVDNVRLEARQRAAITDHLLTVVTDSSQLDVGVFKLLSPAGISHVASPPR